MRQFIIRAHKGFFAVLILFSGLGYAQQSKTYKESFEVSNDAEVVVNTSYADVAFETWNRNTVEVEAVVTLEGASEEEAQAYFENQGIEIMGNSSRVEVRTRRDRNWAYGFDGQRMEFDFDFPKFWPMVWRAKGNWNPSPNYPFCPKCLPCLPCPR